MTSQIAPNNYVKSRTSVAPKLRRVSLLLTTALVATTFVSAASADPIGNLHTTGGSTTATLTSGGQVIAFEAGGQAQSNDFTLANGELFEAEGGTHSGTVILGATPYDSVTISGTLTVNGVALDMIVATTGAPVSLVGGTIAVTGGAVLAMNALTTDSGSTLSVSSGTLELALDSGAFVNNGLLVLGQDTVFDPIFINDGPPAREREPEVRTAPASIQGITAFSNTGTVIVAGGSTFAVESIANAVGATISVGEDATLQGTGNTLDNSGIIDVAANGTVTDAGDINNLGTGVINFNGATGTATLVSGTNTITNVGDINVVGAGAVDVTGDLANNAGGTLDVTGGDMTGIGALTNAGAITVASGMTLGATSITNTNQINVDGTLDGTVANNTGGTLTITGTGTTNGLVTNAATLNSAGDLAGGLDNQAGGTANLSAGTVGGAAQTNAGIINITGGVMMAGTLSNTAGSELNVTGGNLSGLGAVTNAGEISIDANRIMTATSVGVTGVLDVNGTLISNVTNNAGGDFDLAGALTGTLGTAATSTTDITTTGSVSGLVTNGGTLNSAGNLTSGFANNANATMTLSDGGFGGTAQTNAGTLNINGDVAGAGTLNNTNMMSVAGGTLDGMGAITSDGNLIVFGTGILTATGVTNTQSLGVVGVVNSDIVNSDTGTSANIDGVVNGTILNQNSASLGVSATGDVSGLVTNSADMTSSGDLNGGLTNSGTAELSGGSVAGITNSSSLEVTGDTTVSGTVANNTGGTIVLSLGDLTGITTLTNSATIAVGTGRTLGAATVNNSGGLINLNGALDGDLNNEGTTNFLAGSSATGAIANSVNGSVQFLVDQVLTDTLSNSGTGVILVANGVTVSGVTALTNSSTITLDDGSELAAGTIANNTGGEINIGTNATLRGTANTLNNAAVINVGTGGTVTDAGDINNLATGDINFNGTSGTATLASGTNTINNDGDINVVGAGSVAVTGDINNNATGTLDIAGGDMSGVGVLTNAGVINVDTGRTLSATSIGNSNDLNIDGTVVSNVTNSTAAGDVNVAGTLTGTLSNNAGAMATVTGAVSGLVSNDGTLATSGALGAGIVTGAGSQTTVSGGSIAARAGGVASQNAGTMDITGTATLAGDLDNTATGTLTVSGGDLSGVGAVDNAGVLTVDTGRTLSATSIANSNDLNIDGTVVSNVTNSTAAGDVNVAGTLTGTLSNGAGANATVTSTGAVSGLVSNDGTLTSAGALNGGLTNNSGGSATINGTTIGGAVVNNAGAMLAFSGATSLNGATLAERAMTNSGMLSVGTGIAVTNVGALINNNAITIGVGGLLSAATIDNNGGATIDVGDNATLQGTANTLNNSGTINVGTGGTITDAGDINNLGTGIINFNGTAGTATLNSGTLTITNVGDINVNGAGAVAVTGDLANNTGGTLDLIGGDMTGIGTLTNTGTITVASGLTLGSTTTSNNAGGVITLDGTLDSVLNNAGTTNLNNGAIVTGAVTNTGSIVGSGNSTIASLNNTGGSVDFANGTFGETLTVTGATIGGGGSFDLDIDLADGPGGVSGNADRIIMTGSASGAITLNLNAVNAGGLQVAPTILLQNGAGGTITANGVPAPSTILYTVETQAADIVLQSQVNPAVAGIAGGIVVTQSLIDSIVNRPTSPFVGGLYSQDGGDCGYGGWARATGGTIDAEGGTSNGVTNTVSTQDMRYGGLQFGSDFGCFNESVSGWDLAVGGFGGFNAGSTTQTVPVGGTINRTTSDFDQAYLGVYVSGAKGPLSFDLQLRTEQTEYSYTDAVLGLNDTEIDSSGVTFSGSASYAIPLNDTGLTLTPTAGFAMSRTDVDTLVFGTGDTLTFEDFDKNTAFAGATLSNTVVGSDGLSATNYFGTATVYTDFNQMQRSTFTETSSGTTQVLTSDGVGPFGEISVGVNHVRILEGANWAGARQLSASIRLDARMNSNIESYGVTGQLRFQF